MENNIRMVCDRIVSQMQAYQNSRHSVADDDCLRDVVVNIPVGVILDVRATTTDSVGGSAPVHLRTQKIGQDTWRVITHWFHETDKDIQDSLVSHDLIWVLRERGVRVSCKPPLC